mgnify:CR=1
EGGVGGCVQKNSKQLSPQRRRRDDAETMQRDE